MWESQALTKERPFEGRTPDSVVRKHLDGRRPSAKARRPGLAVTIDQLLYRSSPKTIDKREVASFKGFFVDPQTGPRTDNIIKVAAGVGGFVAVMLIIRKVAK